MKNFNKLLTGFIVGLISFSSLHAQTIVVSTLSGTGIGSVDGDPKLNEQIPSFYYPSGIVLDASGNLYVADEINSKIRKVSVSGVVTTLVGSGIAGNSDGVGTDAEFNRPTGIAIDASGNLYVADRDNNKIRKVSFAGEVSTFAGSGSQGSTDGAGDFASFNKPTGVAIDGSGNVYVADQGNNKIRKITSAGVVSTLAGSGIYGSVNATGTAASFREPYGLAIDASANIYVADKGNNKIRKITSAGVVTTFAGSGAFGTDDGLGSAASFDYPMGITFDNISGNLYITDADAGKVRKITMGGEVTTLAGKSMGDLDANASIARFEDLTGIAIDASGIIYLADRRNNKIRKLTPEGNVTTWAGSGAKGSSDGSGIAASFFFPTGIAVDASGNVYVLDNSKIRKVSPGGFVTPWAGTGEYGNNDGLAVEATFSGPNGIVIDGSGNLYVTDLFNYNIRKITPGGIVSTFAGSGVQGSTDGISTEASFDYICDITIDPSGNLFVVDGIKNNVRKITPAGVVSTVAGNVNGGYRDGTGTTAEFRSPRGITADASGNLYVTDTYNNRIRKITPQGEVSTFAGNNSNTSIDGTGTGASFNRPNGITIDPLGNLIVTELEGNKIRKITPTGVVTTLAGNGTKGSIDGEGSSASFSSPQSIAIDQAGNLYIADSENRKIRKITISGTSTSTQQSEELSSVTLYPNPVQNTLFVSSPGNIKTYSLHSIEGNIIQEGVLENSTIAVVGLTKGMYFVKMHTDKGSKTFRFVKE